MFSSFSRAHILPKTVRLMAIRQTYGQGDQTQSSVHHTPLVYRKVCARARPRDREGMNPCRPAHSRCVNSCSLNLITGLLKIRRLLMQCRPHSFAFHMLSKLCPFSPYFDTSVFGDPHSLWPRGEERDVSVNKDRKRFCLSRLMSAVRIMALNNLPSEYGSS